MLAALRELCESFVDSTNVLVERFAAPLPKYEPFDSTCPAIHEDGQGLLVVKLQNSWGDFCRSLITISASNNSSRIREAVESVVRNMGFNNPVWHSPEFVARVAKHLTLSNADHINLHLSANLSSGRVTDVRNYIVHPTTRNESKYKKVAVAEGLPGVSVGALMNVRFPGGATLFERWVRDLQRTASNSTS